MITTLQIKNIGIIDDLSINLNQGLNVLTGETGAGKTLIIDSLSIISGGRFSKEMIRKGEEYSYVELGLYLPKHERAIEGNIIVSREISTNGRNLCKINGRLVTVTELKEFMSHLINIHGQNDNQSILNVATHISYLDGIIGEKMQCLKQKYQLLYKEYCELKSQLKQNDGDEKERQRKIDLLSYQLKEIKQANLKLGEEGQLLEKQKKLSNSEKIVQNLKKAYEVIKESAIEALNTSIRGLESIQQLDERYGVSANNLKSMYYELQELARELEDYEQENEWEPDREKEIEERLDIIYTLKRKYGNTIEEILQYQQQIELELEKIENGEEYRKERTKQLAQIEQKMKEICTIITKDRQQGAHFLCEKINQELNQLEMPNCSFHVVLEKEIDFNPNGWDKVEFQINTNIGEEAKPLVKIASGGEMSRIMLAIKSILANVDEVPVIVFDEIDTGISGKAAKAVSEKMKKIGQHHQVICVTHLANIAAKADYNYYIHKEVCNNKTKSRIKLLNEKETLEEIARIATGQTGEVALEHAKMLRAS